MKRKNILRTYFGKKFGFFDLLLVGLFGGALYILITKLSIDSILITFAWIVIGLTLTPLLSKTFKKMQRKAKK